MPNQQHHLQTKRKSALDLKNYYLNTDLDRSEYAKIHINMIPQEIIDKYKLTEYVDSNGFIYIRIDKGMYGLPQAGIIANKLLAKRLAHHGYYQTRHTPGLWKHQSRDIQFVLIVDDFLVDYSDKEDALHLIAALKQDYEASVDWDAKLYSGITLNWDYKNRTVDLSMPEYVETALSRFEHATPSKPEHQPHKHNVPQYGQVMQYVEDPDTSRPLAIDEIKRLQQIVGTFLFYGRAVDPTTLVALSTIASQQASATENTMAAANKFMNYMATNPLAITRYQASDMKLKIHSDASYLTETNARSRSGGHHYLGNKPDKLEVVNQGGVLDQTGIMKNVMSSAAEAEICAQFINEKEGTILQITLEEMGWPQEATPVQLDNSTALGLATNTITQKRSREIDMRFYWIQDREEQGQFASFWAPAALNKADYQTKHFSAAHHKEMRPIVLHVPNSKTITT
jgi:Reverse transcriptase (RNA-dependent DNA polymerase)